VYERGKTSCWPQKGGKKGAHNGPKASRGAGKASRNARVEKVEKEGQNLLRDRKNNSGEGHFAKGAGSRVNCRGV